MENAGPGRPSLGEDEADAAIRGWRQADVINFNRFVHHRSGAPDHALSSVVTAVERLVVVTQTCDLVRSCKTRPYAQLAVVVEIEDEERAEALRLGSTPHLVHIPSLGPKAFADLDRVATWEKTSLVAHDRAPGVSGDEESRQFGARVGRKFSRFPFPDDFTRSISKLRKRILSKHGKLQSAEGVLLQDIEQIRASARPDWNDGAASVDITFVLREGCLPTLDDLPEPSAATRAWFDAAVRDAPTIAAKIIDLDEHQPDGPDKDADRVWLWTCLIEAWIDQCAPVGQIRELQGEVVNADEYGINRHWTSEALDLDYLSDADDDASDEEAEQ